VGEDHLAGGFGVDRVGVVEERGEKEGEGGIEEEPESEDDEGVAGRMVGAGDHGVRITQRARFGSQLFVGLGGVKSRGRGEVRSRERGEVKGGGFGEVRSEIGECGLAVRASGICERGRRRRVRRRVTSHSKKRRWWKKSRWSWSRCRRGKR
jgi:hypothetical protein